MAATRALLRSWIFVPGDRRRMIDKAFGFAVDAVMLDIEDGVAAAEKETARREIAAALDHLGACIAAGENVRTPARFVRINGATQQSMKDDLAAVVRPGLEGLVVPKVENPGQVASVVNILDQYELEMKMSPGIVQLLIGIETPKGLLDAYAIASSSPRNVGLVFGAEDFGRELGLPLRREGEARDLIYARSTIATAASAARVQAVDAVWPDLRDSEGLAKFASQSRRLGFSGMCVIHPSQIETINSAFSPTAEEIEYAQRVLKAFEDAKEQGRGAVAFGGQLLDSPIVDRARQVVALAESIDARSTTR